MPSETSGNTEVRTIKVQALHDMLMSGQLVLPRFQRANVWTKAKKKALVYSIRNRLPIGSLLVYKSLDPSEQGREVLVDGLQRTIAIRDYMDEPQKFITAESLKGSETIGLLEVVGHIAEANDKESPTEKQVLKGIDQWIGAAENLESSSLRPDDLADILDESLSLDAKDVQKRSIRDVGYDLVAHIQNDAKIDSYPLALVEFTGSPSVLPDIFRNINSGGVPLDEFDEFAIDWIHYRAAVNSVDVAEQIKHKWTVAESKDLVVEQWSDGAPTSGYTFWEYMYGLGRVLKKDFPLLFGGLDANGTSTERVSFYLAALAHGLVPRLSEIRRLPFVLSSWQDGTSQLDLGKFESAVRRSCKKLEEWLKPSAGMKLNQSLATDVRLDNLSQLSQFLVLSMVARTLVGRWIPYSWDERPNWRADWAKLGEELPRHLLLEVLQGSWSGAGDSNAYSATWDSDWLTGPNLPEGFDPLTALVPSGLYVRHRSADEWRQQLDVWLRSETNGAQRVNRQVSKEAKLVLRYIYADMPLNWHEQYTFQIDHELPVSRLSKIIERNADPGWPMSAVGNLALLPDFINDAKDDKTPLEYLESLTEAERNAQQPLVDFGAFFPLDKLTIPKNPDGQDTLQRAAYVALIEERQEAIRERVIAALGLDG